MLLNYDFLQIPEFTAFSHFHQNALFKPLTILLKFMPGDKISRILGSAARKPRHWYEREFATINVSHVLEHSY